MTMEGFAKILCRLVGAELGLSSGLRGGWGVQFLGF